MKLCLILLSAVLLHTEAKDVHKDLSLTVCADNEADKEMIYALDGEEMWHAIFSEGKGVMSLPLFADQFDYMDGTYEHAVIFINFCRYCLDICATGHGFPTEVKDAPQTSVYSKHDVELGSGNTLICYSAGFYPPHVKVSWTRNNVNVTNEATLSRYYINDDGTYSLFSTLSFTPAEGDIYTCTVEHTALDRPLTKTWDVQMALPGVGPSVFCGVGLAVALLGITVGTFLLVKGNNLN